MGSYDTLGERFGLDPDTIDALNARYGEPDAVDRGAGGASGSIDVWNLPNAQGNVTARPIPNASGPVPAQPAGEVDYDADFAAHGARPLPATGANNPHAAGAQPQSDAQKDYKRMVDQGVAPEKARQLAGVETQPGEITVPRAPTDTATQGPAVHGINPTDDGEMEDTGGTALRQGGGAGGGGPAYVGWIPKQRQANFGWSNEEMAPLVAAGTERHEATSRRLETETAIAKQRATIDAAYAHEKAVAARDFERDFQANEKRKQRYVDGELSRLNELALKTQKEVDPEDYWKRLGTGGSFVAALSMAIGQFGAALTGGQNAAMQLIQANIDRNIRAQEHNAAQSGKALDAATNLYAKNLEAFGDRERAIVATRINYLDHVGAELDAMLAEESLPLKQRLLGQKLREEITTDRMGLVKGFGDLSHTQISQVDAFGSIGGGGAGGPTKDLENTGTLPDGTVVQFGNAEQANHFNKQAAYHAQVRGLDQRALAVRNRLKTLDPVADRTEYQSLMSDLNDMGNRRLSILSQAEEQGIVRKEDAERERKSGISYTKGFGGNVVTGSFNKHVNPINNSDLAIGDNAIRGAMDRSQQMQEDHARAVGARIVKRGYTVDAQGNKKPVASFTGQDTVAPNTRAPNGFKPFDPDANVPTQGKTLGEKTPQAPTQAAPAGSGAGGVTFNTVGGGGGGRKGRKRK